MRYIQCARVANDRQNLDAQIDVRKEFCIDRIFTDQGSSDKYGRPGFEAEKELGDGWEYPF